MPNYDIFDHRNAHLTMAGALAAAWAHEMRNQLVGLNVQLRSTLHSLDEISLSQETNRRLESQIGYAIDISESALRAIELFGQVFREDRVEEIAIIELVRDAVRLIAPIARRNHCLIEIVESVNSQQQIRTRKVRLEQILLNIFLFLIRHTAPSRGEPERITVFTQGTGMILISSGNPACAQATSQAFNFESERDLVAMGELELFMATTLTQGLGGTIGLTREGTKITITVQVPLSGEQSDQSE